MTAKMTLKEWKEKATKKHDGLYEYRFKTWKGLTKGDVRIYCKKCDDFFSKRPACHIYTKGGGCQKCGRAQRGLATRNTTEEFIEKATRLHEGIYDYSKVVYVKSNLKVKITCKKHGDFEQTPNAHLKPSGCRQCAFERQIERQRSSNEEFIEASRKIHGDKYDYSRVVYVMCQGKLNALYMAGFGKHPNTIKMTGAAVTCVDMTPTQRSRV